MKKPQIIILVLGIATIIGLYSLPRVVVDNNGENPELETTQSPSVTLTEEMHNQELPTEVNENIHSLLGQLSKTDNDEIFITFADSIASLYIQAGKFDSAAHYFEQSALKKPTIQALEKAGNAYYDAYGYALNDQKINFLAEKARKYLNDVLEKDPKRLDLKTKVAMTFVSSSNPMQGITMLREILEEDPKNESAIFNMGMLSMQSGQYKRAAERFEELVNYYPENIQGQFYLGVSYFESAQKNKAKQQFQLIQNLTADPIVLSSVESYLERL